ncbi:MAG: K(+)-transporting ATPase subunit C [Mucilaginibacter polytrichastri]|nr:K(+)-transporting ATPase subunit C [Mucilaginibacter polytrichastri]
MKTYIIPAIRLTLVMIVLLCVIYPAIIFGIGRLSVGGGDGEKITVNGRTVGYALIGQKFDDDKYFWSRPSAVDYNAAGSAGSNKGPSNPDYQKTVEERIANFEKHNPGVKRSDIPAEMVTASGSGLDPDISPISAEIQVARIVKVRDVSADKVDALVRSHTEAPVLGLFGPSKINVLKLNIALDELK